MLNGPGTHPRAWSGLGPDAFRESSASGPMLGRAPGSMRGGWNRYDTRESSPRCGVFVTTYYVKEILRCIPCKGYLEIYIAGWRSLPIGELSLDLNKAEPPLNVLGSNIFY